MRIVQLIDSLHAGGAEKMAVSYANSLSQKIAFSGLVVSRAEGSLFSEIDTSVNYAFLNKKSVFDFSSILIFKKYLKVNNVEIIHCHSTSFFFAFLMKMMLPKIKMIWHDHYGDSEFLEKRPKFMLKICIPTFDGIIVVNQKLKLWSQEKLKFKNVIYLRNFASKQIENITETILKGEDKKRIISIANLRKQKNHELLIEVAMMLKESHIDWTFHLVGKDFQDNYSKKIKKLVIDNNLSDNIYVYGTKKDIANILNQSEIAILTSKSEGLPVTLLEYGFNKKPVIVTDVGEISSIITNNVNGYIVPSDNAQLFYEKLVKLIENDIIRKNFSTNLEATIHNYFSEEVIIKQYLNWLGFLKS